MHGKRWVLSPGDVTGCCGDCALPDSRTRGSTVGSSAGTWQEHGLNLCQSWLGGRIAPRSTHLSAKPSCSSEISRCLGMANCATQNVSVVCKWGLLLSSLKRKMLASPMWHLKSRTVSIKCFMDLQPLKWAGPVSSHAVNPRDKTLPVSSSSSAVSGLVCSWIFLTYFFCFGLTQILSSVNSFAAAAAVIFLKDSKYFVYCKLLCSNSCGYTVTQRSPSGARFHTHPFICALLLIFGRQLQHVTLAWCHTNPADLSLKALSSIDDCLYFLPAWNCFILANPVIKTLVPLKQVGFTAPPFP